MAIITTTPDKILLAIESRLIQQVPDLKRDTVFIAENVDPAPFPRSDLFAAIKFTVNGQDVEVAYMVPGESCNVEIVADDTSMYSAYIDYYAFGGTFYYDSTKPAAGNLAVCGT